MQQMPKAALPHFRSSVDEAVQCVIELIHAFGLWAVVTPDGGVRGLPLCRRIVKAMGLQRIVQAAEAHSSRRVELRMLSLCSEVYTNEGLEAFLGHHVGDSSTPLELIPRTGAARDATVPSSGLLRPPPAAAAAAASDTRASGTDAAPVTGQLPRAKAANGNILNEAALRRLFAMLLQRDVKPRILRGWVKLLVHCLLSPVAMPAASPFLVQEALRPIATAITKLGTTLVFDVGGDRDEADDGTK